MISDEFVHRLHIEYTIVNNPLISIFVAVPYSLLGIQTSIGQSGGSPTHHLPSNGPPELSEQFSFSATELWSN
jgi:hypothetical protein